MIVVIISSLVIGFVIGDYFISRKYLKREKKTRLELDKLRKYYALFNFWLYVKQRECSIAAWLKKSNFNRVIIYGMKEFGERLFDELENSDVEIVCCMDRYKMNVLGEYNVIDLNDKIPTADLVIVTAISDYDSIRNNLIEKVECPIYSLEYVIIKALCAGK